MDSRNKGWVDNAHLVGTTSGRGHRRQLFAQTLDAFGHLDILVANSGLQKDAAISDMTLEQWNTVIGVNLTGQFLCARAALRIFNRQGVRAGVSRAAGKIIHMSSVHQLIPWAGHVNYAATEGDAEQALLKLIPYGRVGDVEDVANAVVWLASDASDYVVGSTLFIDGGMSLYPEFKDNG
ncbi:MAG: SDR family oxidoreductase [Pseudomonas proteolytica]|uniref:SDR family oxidoreductase n=1 Tax=Pseudomonas proteolytica TaxID=219574 RepID=UPI003F33D7F9